jgi:hypothetical protein
MFLCISSIPKQLLLESNEQECFEILHTLIEQTRSRINPNIFANRQHGFSVRVLHSTEIPDEPTQGARRIVDDPRQYEVTYIKNPSTPPQTFQYIIIHRFQR